MMDPWLDADVVIDVANLRHWVKEAQGGDQPVWPSLALLKHTLDHYGVRTRSFVAALPTRPFVGAGRSERDLRDHSSSNLTAARENIATSIAWVQLQRRDLRVTTIPLRTVDGATIGRGERGVDELAAMAALDLLWHLPEQSPSEEDGSNAPRRGVILVSRDRDVEVCHHIASGRPLFSLGIASVDGRKRARDLARHRGYRYLLLPKVVFQRLGVTSADPLNRPRAYAEAIREARVAIDAAMDGIARRQTKGDASAVHLTLPSQGGKRTNVSSSLPESETPPHAAPAESWEARRRRATAGSQTICIADPVGLQRTGARALGVAGLPGPDTLAQLVLERLCFRGPMGLLCTVSDATKRSFANLEHWVKKHTEELGAAGERYVEAVRATDAEYDRLAEATADHGAVDRAELDLHRRPHNGEQTGRQHLRLEEKEVTVLLAADVLWALLHTDADIALVSDRSVLEYVLENLPSVAAEPERQEWFRGLIGGRVTRIGLHADPFVTDGVVAAPDDTVVPAPTSERPAGLPHEAVLDGALAAEVLGLTGRLHGPELESAVHRMLERGDVVWQAVEIAGDPWDRGLRVTAVEPDSDEEQPFEVWLDRGLLVSDDLFERLKEGVGDEEFTLEARIDPTRPCAITRLQQGTGRVRGEIHQAVVLGPADGGTIVDLDGDETTTDDRHVVPAGHGFTAYRRGMTVIVIWDAENRRVLRLLGPDPDGASTDGDRFDGMPVPGEVTAPRRARTPIDGPEASELVLHAVPLMRWIESTPTARVLVVPTTDTDGYVISSALPHMQANTDARGVSS
jgi:hypothetical protein